MSTTQFDIDWYVLLDQQLHTANRVYITLDQRPMKGEEQNIGPISRHGWSFNHHSPSGASLPLSSGKCLLSNKIMFYRKMYNYNLVTQALTVFGITREFNDTFVRSMVKPVNLIWHDKNVQHLKYIARLRKINKDCNVILNIDISHIDISKIKQEVT